MSKSKEHLPAFFAVSVVKPYYGGLIPGYSGTNTRCTSPFGKVDISQSVPYAPKVEERIYTQCDVLIQKSKIVKSGSQFQVYQSVKNKSALLKSNALLFFEFFLILPAAT